MLRTMIGTMLVMTIWVSPLGFVSSKVYAAPTLKSLIKRGKQVRTRYKEPRDQRGGVGVSLARKMIAAANREGSRGQNTLMSFLK